MGSERHGRQVSPRSAQRRTKTERRTQRLHAEDVVHNLVSPPIPPRSQRPLARRVDRVVLVRRPEHVVKLQVGSLAVRHGLLSHPGRPQRRWMTLTAGVVGVLVLALARFLLLRVRQGGVRPPAAGLVGKRLLGLQQRESVHLALVVGDTWTGRVGTCQEGLAVRTEFDPPCLGSGEQLRLLVMLERTLMLSFPLLLVLLLSGEHRLLLLGEETGVMGRLLLELLRCRTAIRLGRRRIHVRVGAEVLLGESVEGRIRHELGV